MDITTPLPSHLPFAPSTKPAYTKPDDTKPAYQPTKPGYTKPGHTKPTFTKPASTKPWDTKPAFGPNTRPPFTRPTKEPTTTIFYEPDYIYAINATMASQQLEKCQNPDLNNECLSSEMIIKQSRR